MRIRWVLALVLCVLAAIVGMRFTRGLRGAEASYVFERNTGRADALAITAQFRRCATDSLDFATILQNEAAPLIVSTAGWHGQSLSVHQGETRRKIAGRMFTFTRYRVDLGERREADVSYGVQVGEREGEAHTHGFTGNTYGRATPDYVISSYAQLLLLPTPIGEFQKVRFRYQLPNGWAVGSAVDPRAVPRRFGRGTLHDYVFAPLIMGRFTSHPYKELSLRVIVAGQDPTADELADHVATLYRSIAQAFDSKPTDPYLVILCPPDEQGFSTFVEAGFFGQVATVANGQLLKSKTVCRRMVERLAHSSGADQRFPDPSDHWFLPALYTWVADQALARDHPHGPARLESDRYDSYVRMIFEASDVPLATADSVPAAVKGVAALDVLDRSIRDSSNGADSLWAAVPHLREREPTMHVRPFLEQIFHRKLGSFFESFVDSTMPLPFPTLVHPHPGRRAAARDSVALLVAYDGGGFLENCGCKSSQWGGMARLATWSKAFRNGFRGPVFMISAGNTFPTNVTEPVLNPFSKEELALYLKLLAECGCDAAAVGQSELYYGAKVLSDTAVRSPVPFVSASLQRDRVAGVEPYRIVARKGVSLGVSGLVAPWEARTADLPREPVLPAVAGAVDSMRQKGADHIVIAGRIKPSAVREIAAASSVPLVIVSYQPVGKCTNAAGQLFVNDISGFLGEDLVLYPNAGRYGVSVFVLYRDAKGAVVDFSAREAYLTEKIADDPATRHEIDAFYMKVGPSITEKIPRSSLWASEVAAGARFAGTQVCIACHDEQHKQWRETAHAGAFKTLLKQHRQYNPSCVACHVTGFEEASGYHFGDMSSSMANVQCESCHGPGSAHASTAGHVALVNPPAETVCRSCHTNDHSDMTEENFSEYYAKIVH
jgi:hypothetical protein